MTSVAIEIIGELRPLPDFKLPPLGGEANLQQRGHAGRAPQSNALATAS